MTIMRVMKFNAIDIEGLKKLGCEIADDKEVATIKSGDVKIEILQPWRPPGHSLVDFFLTITFPNDGEIMCGISRRDIFEAAGISDEE